MKQTTFLPASYTFLNYYAIVHSFSLLNPTFMFQHDKTTLPKPIHSSTNENLFFYVKAIKQKNGEEYKYGVFIVGSSLATEKSPHVIIDGCTSLTPFAESLHFMQPDSNASSAKKGIIHNFRPFIFQK